MMDVVGWISALILLLTVGSQVFEQWRSGSSRGVSPWLFVGQLAASTGFVIYSAAVGNWVFVAANAATWCAALVGQYLYLRNRARPAAAITVPADHECTAPALVEQTAATAAVIDAGHLCGAGRQLHGGPDQIGCRPVDR